MVQRRSPRPRTLRVLCAALPVAGLLVPLAAAPAPALPAHGNPAVAAKSVLTCDGSDGSPCNDTGGSDNDRTGYVESDPDAPGGTGPDDTATPDSSTVPPPSASPSQRPSGTPQPVPGPGVSGPGVSGRLPDTGSAGALPLVGLAALGCALAGLMVLASRARRR
ncbi:hypothetical protein [Kitasatospora sp. NPDC057198]|uniref:hypothetical protein n=1 Tax=Kitasatospora sp. NPDC057198 TaxID=3346046 RepID=UPI00363A44D4